MIMKRILIVPFIVFLLLSLNKNSNGLPDESGIIGKEHIANYITTIGESISMPVKIGILVSSVILSQDIANKQAELLITCTFKNYSSIPLMIGVGNKYLIDNAGYIYGPSDGNPGILNPGLEAEFQYTYQIPQSILNDPLFFSYMDYIDDNKKKKGIAPKWQVKIKNSSNLPLKDGEKSSLSWEIN
jgi:hypothetical protein